MAAVRGVPLAPEARYRAFAHPEIFSEDVRGPPDAGAPPADVSAFPEHMHAYAANCKRTLHYAVQRAKRKVLTMTHASSAVNQCSMNGIWHLRQAYTLARSDR